MIYTKKESIMDAKETKNTFDSLIKKAKVIKENSYDEIIPSDDFKKSILDEDSMYRIMVNEKENEYNLSRTAFTQLCSKIKVPVLYIDNCFKAGEKELAIKNVNTWIPKVESKSNTLLRFYKDNNIRGLLSDNYSSLDSDEILDILSEKINFKDFNIVGTMLNEERLHLRFIYNKPIRLNDDKDIFTGFTINSSDVGRSMLKINFFVYKQVCTNGLCIVRDRKNLFNQIHRGINKDKFSESLSETISSIDSLNSEVIESINRSNKIKIPYFKKIEDYDSFVKKVQNKTELPKKFIDKAIEKMDEKYSHNVWGLINGLTDIAQLEPFEKRLEIETVSSNLLTLDKI